LNSADGLRKVVIAPCLGSCGGRRLAGRLFLAVRLFLVGPGDGGGSRAADAPSFESIADKVRVSLDVSALIAHNAHVDIGVLQRELPGWQPPEVFDTLKLARRLLPDQPGYKLGMLVRTLNLAEALPGDLAPHRATYDALVTARLFVRLATVAEGHPLTLQALRGESSGGNGHDAASLF
jgi:DNA polymerase III epsilon subunit-like protein